MKYLWAVLVFCCGEILALVIFGALKKAVEPPQDSPGSKWAWTMGILERLTLLTGLLGGFPHVLVVLGALKLGTRLKEDQDSHISNTYFLVGNLISILLAIAYAIIFKALWR